MEAAITKAGVGQRSFLASVYAWMSGALFITAATAFLVVTTPALSSFFFSNTLLFYGLILAELGLVFYLTLAIRKMSVTTAMTAFIGYAVLNGITLSLIFLVYTSASIATTFLVTGLTFGAMSLYGYFTDHDLSTMGSFLFMGLIGFLIGTVVNIFWHNNALYWILTYAGILIFVGLTAYDTQKLKKLNASVSTRSDEGKKASILGALTLYLDFINLFLLLLRVLGRRK